MKKVDRVVQLLLPDIENKTILEVACGRADFSIAASSYASKVFCIDIVDSRLVKHDDTCFEIMDASMMRYSDETFDSVYMYNAFSHIQVQWKAIESECKRVVKQHGKIYIIGTWKIDITAMDNFFGDEAKWNGDFLIVELNRGI